MNSANSYRNDGHDFTTQPVAALLRAREPLEIQYMCGQSGGAS